MQTKEAIQASFLEGKTLFIDKAYRWTSFDVVNKIKSLLRYRLGIKKIRIGHAGTLDPLATGLLIVCTGRATKQIESFQSLDKSYTGTLVLGKTTPSFDLESAPGEDIPYDHIDNEQIEKTALSFVGEQDQVPPLFSAKKIDGERAYTHARKGEHKVLKAQRVHIKSFDITRIALPEVDFSVSCSKGTYIRSLVRDFGESLDSGAYLKALRRTHIGPHAIDDAISIQQFQEEVEHLEKACK